MGKNLFSTYHVTKKITWTHPDSDKKIVIKDFYERFLQFKKSPG